MSRNSVLLLAALFGTAQAQTVTHRWSFNGTGASGHGTVLPDSIAAAPGTIVGTGATRSGTTLTLPGTSNGAQTTAAISAYFDLPNGIISSKTDMTVEIWATVLSSKNWQRLFDFGRMNVTGNGAPGEITNTGGSPGGGSSSRDNFMLAVQRGGNLFEQRLVARNDGAGEIGSNNSVIISPGTQYHFVATFQAGVGANAGTGGRFTWFRNGVEIGFADTNFRLNQIEDVNNWLGRSQYSDDSNSNIAYNEFRLYSGAMSLGNQVASRKAGVDAAMTPVTVADAVTLAPGKKAGVPVLANDSGQAFPSTVEVVTAPVNGTASVLADGRILYTHTNLAATSDSFTYRVSGGGGLSNVSTVSVTTQDALKIANPLLNVPANPPATSLGLVNAFPLSNATGGLAFSNPVCLASPPGDTKRLFVCQKGGLLQMVPDVTAGTPTATTFFDLPALLTSRGESINSGSECGLLGLAFHPNYGSGPGNNRYFYLFYSVNKSGQLYQRVSRFTAQASLNAADTTSELILIEQLDQAGNHNGGDLHFGPDGYLYISVGDEGDGDDTLLNSQLINKDLFAGILRIDVDKDPVDSIEPTAHASIPLDDEGLAHFSIPKTNPFVLPANGGDWNGLYNGSAVSGTVRREFWATGLRNPWRMSFDPGTGALWCGDVGQGQREEIDVIIRGGNYGWVFREALLTGPRTTNPTMPANFDLLYHEEPIYNYVRPGNGAMAPEFQGYSVTGGRVYRGTNIPSLTGKYIFGDYGTGNIWSMDLNGSNVQRIAGENGIAAFGYDPSNGDILLADENGARILRLAATTPSQDFPETLSSTGVFADLTDLAPSPGMVPYDVNLPFWSDHAIKSRWFIVPDGISQFTWSEEGLWTLPSGTVWVKHFDMEMERGEPASTKRIETRLIVKNPTGAYGVSYRWNDAGTEAFLAADGGENFTLNVTEGGNPVPQTWRIPSRAECMSCHTPQAGHALSFNTRQLNLDNGIPGYGGNQLTTLQQTGYLSNDPGSPNLLPRHLRPDESAYSVEARVRSYIAVNCSYCHKDGGTANASWDGRAELTLSETGLVNGEAANNGSNPANKLVVPGDPTHSIVLSRIAATNGFTRMPPLASNVIDTANVDLLTTWINGELDARETYDDWRISNFEPDNDPAGAPESDADGDGATNHEEFLAGTDPNSGGSTFRPLLSQAAGQFTLSFNVPVNRSYRIETSSDLGQWSPWDIPGNQGLPTAGGLIEITQPLEDPLRFFRVELEEN
jgi:uncharacterized repeat protein (TIGR03806 family)